MKITQAWLKKKEACIDAVEYFKDVKESGNKKLLDRLEKDCHLEWANWGIVRMLNHRGLIKYAVYAAELVIDIFAKKYPNDKRPRKAIEAAKQCLKIRSKKNREAAFAAADAAFAAADAATYAAADAAACAAAFAAADAAACAAAFAAACAATYAAADLDNYAANAATYAATYADNMKRQIIEYGISLLKTNKEKSR